MSAAIRASSARERAIIAAQYIRRGATDSRGFDNCFEMGDGDAVMAFLRLSKSPAVRLYVSRCSDIREVTQ
jgi:hypothetical protein